MFGRLFIFLNVLLTYQQLEVFMRAEDTLDAYSRMVQNEGSAAMEIGGNT